MQIRFVITLAFSFIFLTIGQSQELSKEHISQLKFRHIGPVGNRTNSVTSIPGNDQVYYVGAASGGLWKTTDGGLNWKPIFDKQNVHSMGSITLAPSDPEIIYVGTGESFIRSNVSIGTGVYKSTDGGENWTQMGLENTGRISRVLVHPTNPDIVYVAALGHAYAPQKDRGIYKSTDGGKSWRQVLYVNDNTGASDIVMDPTNPRILFAGTWELSLRTWNRTSGGDGSGIHMSRDGGETWKKLEGSELPKGPVGKIALAMTPSDPDRVYALIETGDGIEAIGDAKPDTGELWRSDDKGKTWKVINHSRNLSGRQPYYTRVAASPDRPDEVYFISFSFFQSIDGGRTTVPISFQTQPNWDHHEMWIDPSDGNRMAVAGDGGISISKNRGKSWLRVHLPVAQVYHATTDNAVPYNVLTNRQDGPAMRGPSRSRVGGLFGPGAITAGMWHDVGGGESGFATADPTDSDVVWSSASGFGALGGVVTRYNVQSRQFRQTEIWPEFTAGHPADQVKYRFQWTFPVLISPHYNETVYVTSQVVHRTTDQGQSWDVISPDLTMNDKQKQTISGGLTPDNIGVEYANVIYAFEESPIKEGLFWAGTNDGQVQISQDGGQNWENVTKNIKDLPPLGTVRNIDASKWNEGSAYITIDLHEVGNFQPFVYKTTNYGKTWTKITSGIESGNLSYARNIREDPVRRGLLYLGTENKLYISFDDGGKWQEFMSNLPPTPMYWIDIQEHFNDMVVGTYGRGIWILDDLSPLQQIPANAKDVVAVLFKPKDTYRFQPVTQTMEFFPEASDGADPPFGTALNYWLNEKTDSVKIHITNAAGDTLRKIDHKGQPGINRVWWDLKTDPVEKIVMRTPPRHADWLPLSKERTRNNPALLPFGNYLVPPGDYIVNLSAGDQSFSEQIKILKDPHSEGSLEDIRKQTDLVKKIKEDVNDLSKMINEIELVRRQVYDLKAVVSAMEDKKELLESFDSMDSVLTDFENELTQLRVTGHGQDAIRWPSKLLEKYSYLGLTVGVADFAPADQYVEVYEKLKGQLSEATTEWNEMKSGSLADFQNKLRESGIGLINVKE
ncbi:MAG: glycosyl hydrolase [Cyclobacteriaceae bacterium]